MQQRDRLSCTLVLDAESDHLPKQVSEIMAGLPVHDIEIRGSDIDAVIRRIYCES